MEFRNKDKEALKTGSYTVSSKISIVGTNTVLTDENNIVNFDYEDYRYVPDNGFIGQFVERILDGELRDLPSNTILENKEINLKLIINNKLDNKSTPYDYGNFLITSVTEKDTTGVVSFESADYTKKFNIEYVDSLTYPCIALDLVNSVCEQVGVELNSTKNVYYYTPKTTLNKGDYSVVINNKTYEFNLPSNLNKLDTLMFFEDTKKVIIKTIDNNYNITRTEKNITNVSSSTKTKLTLRSTKYADFVNNDFVVIDNQYVEGNSCRDVIKDVAKLAYSWARINEHNKLCFDFNKKECYNIDEYDKLTTDEYYTSEKQSLTYGPVNKVLIGMSNVDGENRGIVSDDYTEETECAIKIYDNLLTYTDELRQIAIKGGNVLFGIEYTPLNISSIGHPWLEGDELIQLTNVDNEVLCTYPFDRKIEYKGFIKTELSSSAQTKTQSQYENVGSVTEKLNRTEFIVNKQEKSISSIIEEIGDREGKSTTITEDINGLNAEVKTVANVVSEDEGTGRREIKELMKNKLMYLQVYPTDKDIISLYASPLLKASKTLKAISRNITFEGENYKISYLLPTELYYFDENTHDEFVQDNIENKCYVIKRVGVDDTGNKYKLEKEETINYENYTPIVIGEGNCKVYIETYGSAYIKVKGLIKNDLTSQLATEVEVTNKITLSDKKFEIGLSEKLDGKDFTGANIIGEINNDESSLQISADKVNITGFVTFSDLEEKGKTTINGDNIVTGNIDASKVNVTNLNASNITSGTISANKISGGTINGNNVNITNLNASNITGGTLSADKISGGTINGNSVNITNLNASNITGGTLSADNISGGTINASSINLKGVSLGTSSSKIGGWSVNSSNIHSGSSKVDSYMYSNGNVIFGGNYGMLKFDSNPVRITTADKMLLTDSYSESSMASSNDTISVRAFNGQIHLKSNYAVYAGSNRIDSSSSRAIKENIEPMSEKDKKEIYDEIKKMPMYNYDYKEMYGNKDEFGFIIEDIEDTCLKRRLDIIQNEDNKDIKYYSTENLSKISILIIQELQNKIEKLEKRIEELEEK